VLLLPGMVKLKEWAYAGFAITVITAGYSHLSSEDGLMTLDPGDAGRVGGLVSPAAGTIGGRRVNSHDAKREIATESSRAPAKLSRRGTERRNEDKDD